MTTQVFTISGITGGVPPLTFFLCDQNGENCSYLGSTAGTYTASTFYTTASSFLVKVVDSNNCFTFKTINCPGETFFIITEDEFIITTEDGDGLVFI
jgi:hypothetical protein